MLKSNVLKRSDKSLWKKKKLSTFESQQNSSEDSSRRRTNSDGHLRIILRLRSWRFGGNKKPVEASPRKRGDEDACRSEFNGPFSNFSPGRFSGPRRSHFSCSEGGQLRIRASGFALWGRLSGLEKC